MTHIAPISASRRGLRSATSLGFDLSGGCGRCLDKYLDQFAPSDYWHFAQIGGSFFLSTSIGRVRTELPATKEVYL